MRSVNPIPMVTAPASLSASRLLETRGSQYSWSRSLKDNESNPVVTCILKPSFFARVVQRAIAVAPIRPPPSPSLQSVDNPTGSRQRVASRNGKRCPCLGNSSNRAADGQCGAVVKRAVHLEIDGDLAEPVTAGLGPTEPGADPNAAFLDRGPLDGHGGWRGKGRHIISPALPTATIHCTRYSSFAVLMDFNTLISIPPYPGDFLHPVVYACTAVMLVCLFASFITYIVHHSTIRISRKGWHMLLNFCFHTALCFAVFAGGINRIRYPIVCQTVGIVLHYSTLSTMLWLWVTARSIYKQVTKKPQQFQNSDPPPYPKQPMLRFYLISGGVPFIICGITAGTNIKNYGSDETAPYCWMAWEPSLGAFYGPVAFITLITCIYFLCTYVQLKRHPERKYELKERTEEQQRLASSEVGHSHIAEAGPISQAACSLLSASLLENEHSFKAQLRAAAFTLFLFAATWTFGALAVSQGHFLDMIFSCLYGAFCVTLGLFVLIHHCAKRDDVWHCWWSCCPSRKNTYAVQVVCPKVNVNGDAQVHMPCIQESPCPNKPPVFSHPSASHCKLTNLQTVQSHANCLSPVTPCCAKVHCEQLMDDDAHIHVHNDATFRPNMHIHRCLKSRTKPRYFSRHRSAAEREYAYHIPSSIDGSIHSSHTDSPCSAHEGHLGHRRGCCGKADPYPTINQPESSDASTVIYSCPKMAETDTVHHTAHFELHPRRQSFSFNASHNGILKGNMHEAMIFSSDSTGNVKTGPWKNETTV
ncbi:adhesion G protein-coupled receptor A1 isoform X2 [Ambystoma mexicanum]|uniref:adhesion G protein-coupled receptor A1 isoform X2 n=1 Tax=Ambystoma mexicanum TaxID=8296 RepID=UPI0037E83E87